jgi:transcriptional regulator with XRE-family HTH domain
MTTDRRTDPDPIDRHVGMRIRQRRVGLRISQTNLGKALGVTFQQVQKYENGSNRIGASNLFKIAQVMDVDVSYFFTGLAQAPAGGDGGQETPLPASPTGSNDPLFSREGIELVHNFAAISDPEVRRKLSLFVRTLAEAEAGR